MKKNSKLIAQHSVRFAIGALLLALCASVEAQQPKKVPRIGFFKRFFPTTIRPYRGFSAGASRRWLRGGEKYCH